MVSKLGLIKENWVLLISFHGRRNQKQRLGDITGRVSQGDDQAIKEEHKVVQEDTNSIETNRYE